MVTVKTKDVYRANAEFILTKIRELFINIENKVTTDTENYMKAKYCVTADLIELVFQKNINILEKIYINTGLSILPIEGLYLYSLYTPVSQKIYFQNNIF